MSVKKSQPPVRIAIIGAGAVSDYHHVPGIRIDPRAELVAVCDADPKLLEKRRSEWGVDKITTDAEALCADPEVDAVIIATPNFTHKAISLAAARAGKHVMCEKPLALNGGEVREMYEAARDNHVVHMTAFTYRFAPSMRYMKHLIASGKLGEPRHFRSQRFLDWPETSWGWRQYQNHGRRRRPVRHDHPPARFRHRPAGADQERLRRRGPLRPARRRRSTANRASLRRSTTGRA